MADAPADLHLSINGEPRQFVGTLTVRSLLERLGRDPDMTGVAVAVGDRVIRRTDWTTVTLQSGDRVEIVTAAQGG